MINELLFKFLKNLFTIFIIITLSLSCANVVSLKEKSELNINENSKLKGDEVTLPATVKFAGVLYSLNSNNKDYLTVNYLKPTFKKHATSTIEIYDWYITPKEVKKAIFKTTTLNKIETNKEYILDLNFEVGSIDVYRKKHKTTNDLIAEVKTTINYSFNMHNSEKITSNTVNNTIQYTLQSDDGIVSGFISGAVYGDGGGIPTSWLRNAARESIYAAVTKLVNEMRTNKQVATIARSFQEHQTAPSKLSAQLAYNDKKNLLPNNKINALEKSSIVAKVTNKGPGKAYGVNLTIDSENSAIEVPQTVTVGDIPPNNSQKVTVPLKGKRDLASGTATINVQAKEDRGHHARPVKLKIDTVALKPPKLVLTNALLEDSAGLAKGDGDQQPENTETIQVEPILKNRGSGQALDVEVRLTQVSKGVEIVQGKANVGQLAPGEIARPQLAFRIPHSFDRSQIQYTINAKDTRGMSTQKSYQESFIPQQPKLAATHQVVNRLGKPVSTLKNGKKYQLRITPKNHGNNYAKNLRILIDNYPPQIEIQGSNSHQIKELPPQSQGSTWSVPFVLSRSFTKDQAKMKVTYEQSHFPNTYQTFEWPVRVRSPKLVQRVELLQGGSSKGEIPLTSRPTFRVSITNRGTMEALDVDTAFSVQQCDFSKEMGKKIGKLPPGETAYRDFEFYVPGDVEPGNLTIDLVITQSDFPDHKPELAGNYQFVPQTAKVQKVSGTSSAASGSTLNKATPPEVRFLTPSKGMSTKKSEIPVEAILLAFGEGNAIDRVSATLNGNQLPVRSSGASEQEGPCLTRSYTDQKKLTVKGQIPLKSGSNKLILKAIDRNGRSQIQTLTFTYNKPKTLAERIASLEPKSTSENQYLLAVGISDYAHVPNVEYAEKSTEFFVKAARKIWGIPSENITTLLGSEASGTYLKAQLENIVNRIDDGDTLYFYYAGHGVPAPDKERVYILPQDATEEAYKDSELALDRLYQIFGDSSAKRVIAFIDACFSGRIGEEKQLFKGTAPAALVSEQTLKQNVPQHMTIFTAGDEDDFANSYESKQHRLFSYYLIEGLLKQPKDLHSYVAELVEERSRAKGMTYTQEPEVYGEKYISW